MPIKTIKRVGKRGRKTYKQVRGPLENRIVEQHFIVRYSLGGLTVLIGVAGLVLPILPGWLLIVAGVGVITKKKSSLKTAAYLVNKKTKETLQLRTQKTLNTKNNMTDKFIVLSQKFSRTLGEVLSESTPIIHKK